MKIAIGADGAGFPLKELIKMHLEEQGYHVMDCGAYNTDRSDYPEYAGKVAEKIISGECELGILCCGTGVGMSIAANKIHGIRAAAVSEHYSARYSRMHNNANILCLGSRTLGAEFAMELTDIFLKTRPVGGRHAQRLKMIEEIEKNQSI